MLGSLFRMFSGRGRRRRMGGYGRGRRSGGIGYLLRRFR